MSTTVRLHPHAAGSLIERGVVEAEVIATVTDGERFQTKFERIGFRRNFAFDDVWRGRHYATKQVEAYAVEDDDSWLVITVIARFF